MMRNAYEGLGILMWGGRGDRLRFLSDILFDIAWPPISHIILCVWYRLLGLVCSWRTFEGIQGGRWIERYLFEL